MQEVVHNDQKAACSAVFILLYVLTLLICSLFRMSGQDSAGRNREIHAAAICTAVLWVIPIWGIDRQALIAVRGPLSVLFWSYYSHYSNIMRLLCWLFKKYEWRFGWVFIVEIRLYGLWRRRRSSNSSFIVHFHLPLSNGWADCPLLLPGSIRVLEAFKPTSPHGWTKLSAQSINLVGDGGTLVLSHVIRKTLIDTYLNSQNN